jgi:hypothetical protein
MVDFRFEIADLRLQIDTRSVLLLRLASHQLDV